MARQIAMLLARKCETVPLFKITYLEQASQLRFGSAAANTNTNTCLIFALVRILKLLLASYQAATSFAWGTANMFIDARRGAPRDGGGFSRNITSSLSELIAGLCCRVACFPFS